MTTLGMAASSSTTNVSGVATRRGEYSARKTAVSRPTGAARTIAIIDDRTVPTMNAKAP